MCFWHSNCNASLFSAERLRSLGDFSEKRLMIAACRIFYHEIIEIKAATPTHEEHFELTILTMKFVLVTFLSAVALATLVESQQWIPWNTSKGVPQLQAARGREADYRPLYIIRARKGVDPWIPGKFNADTGKAYIPFNGQELLVTDFEVRCCGSKENVLDFHFLSAFRWNKCQMDPGFKRSKS